MDRDRDRDAAPAFLARLLQNPTQNLSRNLMTWATTYDVMTTSRVGHSSSSCTKILSCFNVAFNTKPSSIVLKNTLDPSMYKGLIEGISAPEGASRFSFYANEQSSKFQLINDYFRLCCRGLPRSASFTFNIPSEERS
jgi:hypothetical protein